MARPGEFVDPEYDRKLAAFKAMRAEMRKEEASQKPAAEPVKSRAQANNNNNVRRY